MVESEIESLPADRIEALRKLPAVNTLIVEERELAHVIAIHRSRPGELVEGLGSLLDGMQVRNVSGASGSVVDVGALSGTVPYRFLHQEADADQEVWSVEAR